MSVTRGENPPDSAAAGDVYVDTYDEDKIYIANADYDQMGMQIAVDSRPGEALGVSSKDGSFCTFKINRGGPTGTPTLVNAAGDGSVATPYQYTLILYDNTNSNYNIVNNITIQGDAHLSFTGSDQTIGAVVATSEVAVGSNAVLTIAASLRPAAALTFSSRILGNEGNNIKVAITRAGATGTSSVARTGAGTRSSPFVYTFTTYDNNDSNADFKALLAADFYLFADSTDTTTSTAAAKTGVNILETTLDNGVGDYLDAKLINIVYDAHPADLTTINDDIPKHIPNVLKNVLAEYLSSRLSTMEDGGSVAKARIWRQTYEMSLQKARSSKNSSTYPNGLRPA